jgi:hypothetical protein
METDEIQSGFAQGQVLTGFPRFSMVNQDIEDLDRLSTIYERLARNGFHPRVLKQLETTIGRKAVALRGQSKPQVQDNGAQPTGKRGRRALGTATASE